MFGSFYPRASESSWNIDDSTGRWVGLNQHFTHNFQGQYLDSCSHYSTLIQLYLHSLHCVERIIHTFFWQDIIVSMNFLFISYFSTCLSKIFTVNHEVYFSCFPQVYCDSWSMLGIVSHRFLCELWCTLDIVSHRFLCELWSVFLMVYFFHRSWFKIYSGQCFSQIFLRECIVIR